MAAELSGEVDRDPVMPGQFGHLLEPLQRGPDLPLMAGLVDDKPDALGAGEVRLPGNRDVPAVGRDQRIDLSHAQPPVPFATLSSIWFPLR